VVGKDYGFKLAGKNVTGRVERIVHRVDVNTLDAFEAEKLQLNEIALVRIVFTAPVVFDAYKDCRATGSFIVIDRLSNGTAGAGMIRSAVAVDSASQDQSDLARLRAFEIEFNALVRKHFPHWEAKDVSKLFG
jgi:sulfate adenylyltransferase subunit 1